MSSLIEMNQSEQLPLWAERTKNSDLQEVRESLLTYFYEIKEEASLLGGRLLSKDVISLLENTPNAFLFGLLADQSVKAEIAWSLPFYLSQRAGHCDVFEFSKMSISELEVLLRTPKPIHRYPNKIADYIVNSSQLLIEKWNGDISNVWKKPAIAIDIVKELQKFKGIGEKKAYLGVMLLVRDFGLDIPDTESINIAYDVHIRRVFLRSGLAKEDTSSAVLAAAKELYPSYPGILTTPVWMIGRSWCRPSNPDCDNCVISSGCSKKINLGREINA